MELDHRLELVRRQLGEAGIEPARQRLRSSKTCCGTGKSATSPFGPGRVRRRSASGCIFISISPPPAARRAGPMSSSGWSPISSAGEAYSPCGPAVRRRTAPARVREMAARSTVVFPHSKPGLAGRIPGLFAGRREVVRSFRWSGPLADRDARPARRDAADSELARRLAELTPDQIRQIAAGRVRRGRPRRRRPAGDSPADQPALRPVPRAGAAGPRPVRLEVALRQSLAFLGGGCMGYGAGLWCGCTSGQRCPAVPAVGRQLGLHLMMVFAGGYLLAYPWRKIWSLAAMAPFTFQGVPSVLFTLASGFGFGFVLDPRS